MGARDAIRSISTVGLYQVTWMKGVSEAMEEAITVYLLRYPILLSPGPLRVSIAGEEMGRGALFRTLRRGRSRELFIGAQWWKTAPEQREYDFIMAMLLEKLALEGKLTFEGGGLRLQLAEGELFGDSAAARLNQHAGHLFDTYN